MFNILAIISIIFLLTTMVVRAIFFLRVYNYTRQKQTQTSNYVQNNFFTIPSHIKNYFKALFIIRNANPMFAEEDYLPEEETDEKYNKLYSQLKIAEKFTMAAITLFFLLVVINLVYGIISTEI